MQQLSVLRGLSERLYSAYSHEVLPNPERSPLNEPGCLIIISVVIATDTLALHEIHGYCSCCRRGGKREALATLHEVPEAFFDKWVCLERFHVEAGGSNVILPFQTFPVTDPQC